MAHATDRREKATVLCELGNGYGRAGQGRDAVEYLQEGIERFKALGDRFTAASDRIELGRAHSTAGDPGDGREDYVRAARDLEPFGPTEALACAYMRIAAAHGFNFEYEEGLAMAERALAVAETAGADSIRIWTYNFLGMCLIGCGRIEEGYESLQRSYREAMEKNLRWIAGNALNNIFANKQFAGEPRAREVLADLGLMRDLHAGAFSSMNVLIAETQGLYFTGEFENGVAVALKAAELGSAAGNKWVIRFAEIQLIQDYVEQGRLEDARPLLGITHGERQRDYGEAVAIIRFHLAEGDPAKGLDAARLLAEGEAGPIHVEVAVHGLLAAGAVDEANVAMIKFDGRRPWLGKSPYVLRAHARLALAEGNHAMAMQCAQPALESFQSVDYKPDVARTHLVLAEAHAAADMGEARKHVELAAGIAAAIGSGAIRRDAEKLKERPGGEPEPAAGHHLAAPTADGPLGGRAGTA